MRTETTKTSWEDVIFESRNRTYGAYSIRRSYDENIFKASLIAICFAALVFGLIQVAALFRTPISVVPPGEYFFAPLPPPTVVPDSPKPQTAKLEPKANPDLLARVVIHDVVATPPVEKTDPAESGSKDGTSTSVVIRTGTEPGIPVIAIPLVTEPPPFVDHPQVMPAYKGGVSAMVRFISGNIRYPRAAQSIGEEGTVFVRFVINNQGQVVDVEVIKGVSALLDKEAMRIVAAMTKWKPGMQNDIPVNVHMVLPIKFAIERD